LKFLSSVVLKEINPQLIFALSLEYESEEFFKFEGVTAAVLKQFSKAENFTQDDLVNFILKEFPDVKADQVKKDMIEFCDFLKTNKFIA